MTPMWRQRNGSKPTSVYYPPRCTRILSYFQNPHTPINVDSINGLYERHFVCNNSQIDYSFKSFFRLTTNRTTTTVKISRFLLAADQWDNCKHTPSFRSNDKLHTQTCFTIYIDGLITRMSIEWFSSFLFCYPMQNVEWPPRIAHRMFCP